MNKFLYGFIFLFTSLYAGLKEEDMAGIYIEFGVFLTVVFIMAVISNKISSKHAKEYAEKNKIKVDTSNLDKKDALYKENRIKELSKLMDDDVINKNEFLVMKRWLYN